ncbi:CHAT domain-containing protein [Oricola indica]|jgi:CHAT domain-containing protein/TPR repeat protein|uniref:CHAT domain-containing protein n=1 Tax=Oricola indica TaxID=2872591 RepID=UPI001CC02DEC|nr:CHAT domain-containing protein [Oricola indica]
MRTTGAKIALLFWLLLSGIAGALADGLDPNAPIDPKLLEGAEAGDAASLYNLGWIHLNRENNTENSVAAQDYFERTLDAYQGATGDDLKWKAETFANLAYIHLNRGSDEDLNTSIDYFNKALDTYALTEGEDFGSYRSSLYNLGWIYLKKGGAENLTLSRTYLQRAIDAYADATGDDLKWKAALYRMLSDADQAASRYSESLDALDNAITIYGEIGEDGAELSHALESWGMALQGLSKYEEAITYFEKSRAIRTEIFGDISTEVADTYLDEGISLEGAGKYRESLDTYTEALLRYSKVLGNDAMQVGWVTNNIGWVHRRLEEYEVSKRWFLKAHPIIARHEGRYSRNIGKVNINIGIIEHYLGNEDSAIRWTMKAMPFIKANNEITLDEQRWAYDTLARAFRAKGDTERAIAFAKLAVNAQQSIRSANKSLSEDESKELKDEWRWLYQHLADMLIEQGRFVEAQAVLNMEKEQEVFEFLRRDSAADLRETKALLNDTELGEEEKIVALAAFPLAAAQELDRLVAKLDSGEATAEDEDRIFLLQESVQVAADDFEAQVDAFLESATGPKQEVYKAQLSAVGSYQDLLTSFEEKTAILQIAAIDQATHIFLTLPELTLHEESNISKAELSRMTFDALVAIEARGSDANTKLGALYDVLVRPVAKSLADAGVKVVMLNLDGFLRYVPFAALYDGQRYFIEDYAVALYTSSVPTRFERGGREAQKSAGFGVTAAHPGFSPLPGVRREIETIFAGDDASGVLQGPAGLDEDFSERSLRRTLLSRPSILHIASHFNLIPGREDDSFLLLGDGSHLPLSDIRSKRALSFKGIDLVTLSACQTARGGGDGSEIEGFGATAQLNGASSVMASLWPVADEATARLMGDFYEGMVRDGLSKADALRAAQIRMMSGEMSVASAESGERAAQSRQKKTQAAQTGFSHPYFWSPFVLMGNWL